MSTLDPTLVKQGEGKLFAVPTWDFSQPLRYKGNKTGFADLNITLGDLSPIQVPSPTRRNEFINADVVRAAPDLSEGSLWEILNYAQKSFALTMKANDCPYTLYIVWSDCVRPDVFPEWRILWIIDGARLNEVTLPPANPQKENAEALIEFAVKYLSFAEMRPMKLAQKAESTVVAEILDTIYADQQSCGTCTPYSAGCDMKFALASANPASIGLSGQCVFTKDGINYGTDDINSLLGGNGTSLQAVGLYLVVTQSSTAQHHYALKSDVTDDPNTGNWAAVTDGYVTGGGGTCSVVDEVSRLYVGGLNGYIYATDDITSDVTVIHNADLTTEDFNAINFNNGNLLAVGDNATILLSTNAYNDFSQIVFSVITPPSALTGVDLTACWVWNATNLVVCGQGEYWYTTNGGDTWAQRGLGNFAITEISDLQFSTDVPMVGAMTANTASVGYVFSTVDGGRSWYNSTPFMGQISDVDVSRYNAVALCGTGAVFVGGLKSGSTDGVLAEATN